MSRQDERQPDRQHEASREELAAALREMQRRVEELQGRLAESRWLEDALRRRTRELSERVKELDCLHAVSECLRGVDRAPESALGRVVNLLPAAFRDPERTVACLTVGGRRYCSPGFRPSEHALVAPIRISRRDAGSVEVHVRPRRGRDEEPAFLPEERTMLETVAALLANALGLRADAMRG